MHPYVHCSTVYNSQDMEATFRAIDSGMDEEDVVHGYTYIIEYFSAIKKNEMPFGETWMDLEYLLSEVSQTEEEKYHMTPHIRGI